MCYHTVFKQSYTSALPSELHSQPRRKKLFLKDSTGPGILSLFQQTQK